MVTMVGFWRAVGRDSCHPKPLCLQGGQHCKGLDWTAGVSVALRAQAPGQAAWLPGPAQPLRGGVSVDRSLLYLSEPLIAPG